MQHSENCTKKGSNKATVVGDIGVMKINRKEHAVMTMKTLLGTSKTLLMEVIRILMMMMASPCRPVEGM